MPDIWFYGKSRQWVADVKSPCTGKRERWYLGRSEPQARRAFYLRMAEQYRGADDPAPPPDSISCAELAARYVEWAESNRAPATAKFIKSYLRWLILAPCGSHRAGELPAHELTPQHIEQIKAAKCRERKPRSVNAFVTTVKACWRWGLEQGFLTANPLTVVKPVPREARRDKSVSQHQVGEFLDLCDTAPPLGAFCRLLYLTGMRRGELDGLPWSAYDAEKGTLIVNKHKTAWRTRLPREIVLSTAARALLDDMSRNGAPIIPVAASALYQRLRRLQDKHSSIAGIGFHSMRWAAINRMREAGYAPDEIAQVVGHSSIPTTLGYMSYDRDRLRRMVNAIE